MNKYLHKLLRLVLFSIACLCSTQPTLAAPPVLESSESLSSIVFKGKDRVFRVRYKDSDNDKPESVVLVVEGPNGSQKYPYNLSEVTGNDYRSGINLEQSISFAVAGDYSYYFTTETVDGTSRLPGQGGNLPLRVVDPVLTWIQLAVGEIVVLFILPFIVFYLARSLFPRSKPRASQNFAVILGGGLGFLWFLFLFNQIYNVTIFAVVGVILLSLVLLIASRNK